MNNIPITVLDHIENLTVPGAVCEKPVNDYAALVYLRQGLEFLYQQAAKCDQAVRKTINPDGKLKFLGMGNLPEFDQIPRGLLTCGIHWYAVSACQYVRLVGAIAYRLDNTRPFPPDYVRAVIPEVLAFRDKVAAHFAWSSQHSKDNDAERLASIIPPLSFVDDSFHVAAFSVGLNAEGKRSDSSSMEPWSICKVHERMRARYWSDPKARYSGLMI